MNYTKIIKKLIGEIKPIGESNTDEIRLKNLKKTCSLVEDLLDEIHSVSKDKNRQENSIKIAGMYADDFIKQIFQNYNC